MLLCVKREKRDNAEKVHCASPANFVPADQQTTKTVHPRMCSFNHPSACFERRGEVYLDRGIRRGTDVLKALALGAHAVLVGHPILWGLAVNGLDGVQHVLELLYNEFTLAM